METVWIIGGGAAGFFAACSIKSHHPQVNVCIIEQQADVLQKVKISGGGRCNVTHACFDARDLMSFYPRGGKALLGMFNRFQPADTMAWFEERGVELKIEADGRIFPKSNSSQSIIDCLLKEAKRLGISILTKRRVTQVQKNKDSFLITVNDEAPVSVDRVVIATGGSRFGHDIARGLGHHIVPPVPSLFTFTIKDPALRSLSGLSIPVVSSKIAGLNVPEQIGPLLVTHWGLSGPTIIKLSAWGAVELAKKNYQFEVELNLLPDLDEEGIYSVLTKEQAQFPNKHLTAKSPFRNIPKRFWVYILGRLSYDTVTWKGMTDKQLRYLLHALTSLRLDVVGKSNFKEEFVTAGGIELKEIDSKTMESKCCPGLYFAGEILNIDGVTGGFNFQNAWTTGYLLGKHLI